MPLSGKPHILVLLLLFTAPALCSAADVAYQGTHILTHGALEELAQAYQKKHGSFVFVKGGGCTDGIAVVVNRRREMGGVCCPLPQKTARLHNLVAHRVGVDIKAVIVHPGVPVKNLTLEQVAGIHSGAITNWRVIGGKDAPIALVYRDHCRDMEEPVRRVLGIKGAVAKKAIIVKTDQEIVEYVKRFPGAIGVVSTVFAEKAKVKMVSVDGAAPTPENAEKGLYPLTGDLFIVTKGAPSGDTKRFLDFVLSDAGQKIVRKNFGGVR